MIKPDNHTPSILPQERTSKTLLCNVQHEVVYEEFQDRPTVSPVISQTSWNNRETTQSIRWQGRKTLMLHHLQSRLWIYLHLKDNHSWVSRFIKFKQIIRQNFFQFVHINSPHMSQLPVIVILPKETPPYCPRSSSSSFQIDNILQDFMSYMFPSLRKTSTLFSRHFKLNSSL